MQPPIQQTLFWKRQDLPFLVLIGAHLQRKSVLCGITAVFIALAVSLYIGAAGFTLYPDDLTTLESDMVYKYVALNLRVEGKTIERAAFSGAAFRGTNFSDMTFANCTFTDGRMSYAVFSNVKFIDCTFSGMSLNNATFTHARFENCTFDTVQNLKGEYTSVLFAECRFRETQFDGPLLRKSAIVGGRSLPKEAGFWSRRETAPPPLGLKILAEIDDFRLDGLQLTYSSVTGEGGPLTVKNITEKSTNSEILLTSGFLHIADSDLRGVHVAIGYAPSAAKIVNSKLADISLSEYSSNRTDSSLWIDNCSFNRASITDSSKILVSRSQFDEIILGRHPNEAYFFENTGSIRTISQKYKDTTQFSIKLHEKSGNSPASHAFLAYRGSDILTVKHADIAIWDFRIYNQWQLALQDCAVTRWDKEKLWDRERLGKIPLSRLQNSQWEAVRVYPGVSFVSEPENKEQETDVPPLQVYDTVRVDADGTILGPLTEVPVSPKPFTWPAVMPPTEAAILGEKWVAPEGVVP